MFDVFKVPAEVGIDVVEVVARLAVSVWSVDLVTGATTTTHCWDNVETRPAYSMSCFKSLRWQQHVDYNKLTATRCLQQVEVYNKDRYLG